MTISELLCSRKIALRVSACVALILGLTTLSRTHAQSGGDFDLSWHTIDAGGVTQASGGSFSLGGTAGQPDAGAAGGGEFLVEGGFWPVLRSACICPADVNFDGLIDGEDVQKFIDCLFGGGTACACADVDGNGAVTEADVSVFVAHLLSGEPCPA